MIAHLQTGESYGEKEWTRCGHLLENHTYPNQERAEKAVRRCGWDARLCRRCF